MAKKIKKMQIFRHVIQVVLFFLLPGLYTLAFSEFKNIYGMIIDGNFNFIQALPGLIEFITVILLTILLGRFFCGWLCAFGTYNDWIYLIGKNVFKIKFKVNEKVDFILKYTKYIVLLAILIIVCTFESNILNGTSPWDAFAQITDFSYVLTNLTIGLIILVLITIGAAFVERFFCRYLCPLGAIFAIFSKLSIFKISKPGDKCGKCTLCTTNCSMGIPLYKINGVRGGECINCLKCVDVCPRKNAQSNILGEDINPALAGSVAIATFAGIYGINNFAGNMLTESGLASTSVAISSTADSSSEKYKDGTYTGTGTGFKGGTTKVSVTVSNGKITNIDTISHGDTPRYYESTIGTITDGIISSQSTSVDTVSGATFSSRGIIEAVEDALNQAMVISSSSNDTATDAKTNDTAVNGSTTNSATSNDSSYKDGTYTGTGTGFKGATTEMSVTIENGNITSIETVSMNDTPSYYEYVEGIVPDAIISAQSTSVDTVSGATYSSRGIIEAVQDALNQSMGISSSSNDNSSDNEIENTEPPEHGSNREHGGEAPSIPTEETTTTNDTTITNSSTNVQQEYTDGTYTGSGTGFRGATTTVSVTVSGGQITSIDTISHGDTPRYYERTIGTITDEIISYQSTSVDTVSGATFSSRGIIEAVENALSQAL